MRSYSAEIRKRATDALDEIIPTISIDERTPALIARVGKRIARAATAEQASYENLLAAASAEMAAISNECQGKAGIRDLNSTG
jgi:hypothetical protein